MQEKAKEIYMTFLSSKASSQVNVEGQSRLNEKILEEPHPLMFQKLQDQIFNLMKYDSYSRFLKSDLFLKHKRTEEEGEESPDAQTAAKRASRIYNTWAPQTLAGLAAFGSKGNHSQDHAGFNNCFVICKDWNVQNPSMGYVYFINCLTSKFCMMANLT